MDFFFQHKKAFGSLGIILILVPLLYGIRPHKAEAIVPVESITADELSASNVELTGWQYALQEITNYWSYAVAYVLNPLAWMMAKALVYQLTKSIVQWIQNGFQGQPGFITNPEQFLKNAGNTAASLFLENYMDPAIYDLLCEPWRFPVYSILFTIQGGTAYDPQCTLDDVIANAEGMAKFMEKFQDGGWKSFISLTVKKENNYYGMYLSNAERMEEARAKAEDAADTEAQMNKGFMGMKVCESYNSAGSCEYWSIDSPGSWVADQLSWNTTSELRVLELADSIDEVLGALVNTMLNWAYKGILGKTGGTPPPPSTAPTPIPPGTQAPGAASGTADRYIASETTYRQTKENTLNAFNQAVGPYTAALACYTQYRDDWNNCTGIRSTTDMNALNTFINHISGQLPFVDSFISPLPTQIEESNAIIASLQDIKTRMANAATVEELTTLVNELNILIQTTHAFSDQLLANSELRDAQTILEDANGQANNCAALPAACVTTGGGGGGIDFQNAGGGDGGDGGGGGDGGDAGDF